LPTRVEIYKQEKCLLKIAFTLHTELWGSHKTQMMKNGCVILVGRSEGKRPVRRPRHTQENNSKPHLKEKACGNEH
jgi:hypothetical protein